MRRPASSAEFVATAPPSKVLTTFVAWKLKTSASPNPPIGLPPEVHPSAWAASKTRPSRWRRAIASSSSIAHGRPQTWTPTMAAVRIRLALVHAAGEDVNDLRQVAGVGQRSEGQGVLPESVQQVFQDVRPHFPGE